jgi:hypothetical protein
MFEKGSDAQHALLIILPRFVRKKSSQKYCHWLNLNYLRNSCLFALHEVLDEKSVAEKLWPLIKRNRVFLRPPTTTLEQLDCANFREFIGFARDADRKVNAPSAEIICETA